MFDRQIPLAQHDAEVAAAIAAENKRQEDHIELLPRRITPAPP